MAAPIYNDLVFEVNNDGVTGDGMASVDVGGTEEVIAEDVDDGVDVDGGEEANLDEEVRVRKVVDKGKRIMIEEDNLKRKTKSQRMGNGIVIEENHNPSLMDESESETESDFGTDNPNYVDAGMDCNMYSDSESDYSDRSVDYLSDGDESESEDLDLPTGNGLTLMSDQHKGLIKAVKDVMPYADHRQCARHIYEGFRKQFSGVQFRGLFWAASKDSYPELFKKIMDKIKRANLNSHQHLIKKDPKTWSKAFFRTDSNCEVVENGFNECFNYVLLRVRNKPLITMLEAMRVIMLEQMNTFRQLMEAWTCGNLFEVRNGSEAFKVDESLRTCSCRIWKLSRIACPHAVAIIFKLNSVADVRVSSEDNIVQTMREERVMFTDVDESSVAKVGGSCGDKVVQKRGEKGLRGRPRFRRLSAWFGLNHGDMNTSNENQNSDPVHEPETQQSQVSTSSKVEKANQTTNDSEPVQAAPADYPRLAKRATSELIRPREKSQRILQKKLSKNNGGAGSSRFNVQDVE
uniref:Pentatricopeptide repeat-containing protein n=1 Tax=Tanacetum cinerariifolium TaxID=118510 RepID=A0A6L2M1J4_TANCI|nr:pentatricopeptide repeat-containing protein [Tanacetum cinerariifolium]